MFEQGHLVSGQMSEVVRERGMRGIGFEEQTREAVFRGFEQRRHAVVSDEGFEWIHPGEIRVLGKSPREGSNVCAKAWMIFADCASVFWRYCCVDITERWAIAFCVRVIS